MSEQLIVRPGRYETRGGLIAVVKVAGGHPTYPWIGTIADEGVSWAPNGRTYASGVAHNDDLIRRIDDEPETEKPQERKHVTDAAWLGFELACSKSGSGHATREWHEKKYQAGEVMLVTVEEWNARGQYTDAMAEIERLRAELDRERMRLAACGVAALGYFKGCQPEYESASLHDILRLYQENKRLLKGGDANANDRSAAVPDLNRNALTGPVASVTTQPSMGRLLLAHRPMDVKHGMLGGEEAR